MPLCRLTKVIPFASQEIKMSSPAVLLQEGDRWSVVDPSNNNELIAGMTDAFKQTLIDKGLLVIL